MEEDKAEEIKRQTPNLNDSEMDRGQKKKTGSKLVLGRDNPGYNPFQEFQNTRNNWTVSNGSSGSGNGINPPRSFKTQIYRQNPKHKFHKFNRNSNNGGRHFGNNYRNNFNRQPNK